MGWSIHLAVLLLHTISTNANPSTSLKPLSDEKDSSSVLDQQGKSDVALVTDTNKVVATIGSKLPRIPELIVNLPARVDAQHRADNHSRELDMMKRSSKFRNVAFGLPFAEVGHEDGAIQNAGGEDSRLPPFAFNEDENTPKIRRLGTLSAISAPASEIEEDADMFAEINRSVREDEETREAQINERAIQTATEDSNVHEQESTDIADADLEGLDSEKQIDSVIEVQNGTSTEGGQQHVDEKAGAASILQNVDTDVGNGTEIVQEKAAVQRREVSSVAPFPDTLSEKSSVNPSSTAAPTGEGDVFNTIAEYNRWIVEKAAKRKQIKEEGYKKYQQMMFKSGRNIVPVRLFFDTDPLLPPRFQDDFSKRSITPSVPTNKVVENEKTPLSGPDTNKQKQLSGVEPKSNFDTTKSSTIIVNTLSTTTQLPPTLPSTVATTEHITQHTETETPTEGSGQLTQVVPVGEVPDESLAEDRNHTLVHVDTSTIAPIAEEHPSWTPGLSSVHVSALPEDSTHVELISTPEATAEAETAPSDSESSSTIALPDLSSSTASSASGNLTADSEKTNGTNTLPPLLSMPSLNALSSFSSLNSPIETAAPNNTAQSKQVPDRRIDDSRKKSSGTIGLKNNAFARNQKRKHFLHKVGKAQQFEIVDSDQKARGAVVSRVRPGQQIFEHTFRVPAVPQKRTNLRSRSRHLVSNTPIVQRSKQRGTVLDRRTFTSAEVPALLYSTATKSVDPQLAQRVNGISMARGRQKVHPTVLARTLTPPLSAVRELNNFEQQRNFLPLSSQSEWDIIRSELLRFKRQQKKLLARLHRQQHRRRVSGVKTTTSNTRTRSRKSDQSTDRIGGGTRGTFRETVSANSDSESVSVDVNRLRRTRNDHREARLRA
ncbi:hypothetical protein Q1695_012036 [Nippostrongylus brasiliensis]|nr:hypothetical protein Q1695_012036 [Nippostrongylus brasiliensis]